MLADAAVRDAPRAVASWRQPPPSGRHVELDDPAVFHAVTMYGPTSLDCGLYRERDREALRAQVEHWPAPMVSITSGLTITLNLNNSEAELFEQQLRRGDVDVGITTDDCTPRKRPWWPVR